MYQYLIKHNQLLQNGKESRNSTKTTFKHKVMPYSRYQRARNLVPTNLNHDSLTRKLKYMIAINHNLFTDRKVKAYDSQKS